MKTQGPLTGFALIALLACATYAQPGPAPSPALRSQTIEGIDRLLEEMDEKNGVVSPAPTTPPPAVSGSGLPPLLPPVTSGLPGLAPIPPVSPPVDPDAGSFRFDDALSPPNLVTQPRPPAVSSNEGGASGAGSVDIPDYENFTVEQLLQLHDPLKEPGKEVSPLPEPGGEVEPLGTPGSAPVVTDANKTPGRRIVEVSPSVLRVNPVSPEKAEASEEPYVVLGEKIDVEIKERIREAIKATRRASGGTGNPRVTQSVYKATAYCNRVLGRLGLPHHKRYRRDILLSLIRMHERNEAWVDAAKSYERFLEEFAADDKYPFEEPLHAPGIPALRAEPGDPVAWLESYKRGAPTIPETHVRVGKIYRKLGAHRMAVTKFYDAINSTLLLSESKSAAALAPHADFAARKLRHETVANQAMKEIADTHFRTENYTDAIRFYGRLLRVEYPESDRLDEAEIVFKHALSHYRRARENLRREERMNRKPLEERVAPEYKVGEAPEADFAQVKMNLAHFARNYGGSPYAPEAHYVLALTFDQLDQRKESVVELLALLKGSHFRPEVILAEERSKPVRDQDVHRLNRLKGLWLYWKKKTGNYLANKFFEEDDFHNAYRVYEALRRVDEAPEWQVPVLYQIAFCQEKLGDYFNAGRHYELVEEAARDAAFSRSKSNKYLEFVRGMAKWRARQLEDTRGIRQAANRYGIRAGGGGVGLPGQF